MNVINVLNDFILQGEKMNTKQMAKWEDIRNKGKRKYIIKYGLIFWGIPMAILVSLLQYLSVGKLNVIMNVIISIIVFLLGGLLYGLIMWTYLEKRYKDSKGTI